MKLPRLLTVWGPVVLWAAVIFALSSIPHLGTGLGTWDLVLRKIAHTAEYALLGALLYRAIRHAPAALLVASAYAVTDEFHQTFVRGREGTPRDVAIDAIGMAIVVIWLRRGQLSPRPRGKVGAGESAVRSSPAR